MNKVLDGRVALITGAAQGQGAAEARLFVENGARVALADVRDTGPMVDELGDAAIGLELDISSESAWADAVSKVVSAFGRLDILINNAAIHWVRSMDEENLESFERMMSVNLRGPYLGVQAVVPLMTKCGGGSIVNIASTAAVHAAPGHALYGISKWGVRGLTQQAALAYASQGIRVNTVIPGGVNTDMALSALVGQGLSTELAREKIAAAAADPSELAQVVLFLASDQSSFVTGAEIVADGGRETGLPVRPAARQVL